MMGEGRIPALLPLPVSPFLVLFYFRSRHQSTRLGLLSRLGFPLSRLPTTSPSCLCPALPGHGRAGPSTIRHPPRSSRAEPGREPRFWRVPLSEPRPRNRQPDHDLGTNHDLGFLPLSRATSLPISFSLLSSFLSFHGRRTQRIRWIQHFALGGQAQRGENE